MKRPKLLMHRSLMICLLVLAGCGPWVMWEPAPADGLQAPPPPPDSIERGADASDDGDDGEGLIPRSVLFGNPDKAAPRLSPDGKRIAFLAPDDGVLNVWVAPASDLKAAKPITKDRKRGIRRFFWAYTNEHIVFLRDKGGDENWRAYSVDVVKGTTLDLTPMEGVKTQIQQVSHKKPGSILVGLNDREKKYHDVHEVDIRTGKRTVVQINDADYGSFVTDDDFRVRLAIKPTPDGGEEILRRDGDGFKPFTKISMEDGLTTGVIGFDKSGRELFMYDSRNRNTAALTKVSLPNGKPQEIHADQRSDMSGVLQHPVNRELQAVVTTYLRKKWHFFDKQMEADFKKLSKVARGDIQLTSRTLDDRNWTVAFISDRGPIRYYLFNRNSGKATLLFVSRRALEGLPLAPMRPVEIPSRDGYELVSYLTLPFGAAQDGKLTPESPLPMVLVVHGGPWGRDNWGYQPTHQWLANRGYAVLSVNFRGSTGFGKKFINAANREWAAAMHHDLIDAVDWAVKFGIANPDRVAIMGGSYGGYAALVGLTFTPTKFACGVDIVGPSNLVTLLESIPPYWAPYLALFKKRVGDHTTADGRKFLLARSPISRANRIVRPLLIAQGANDPRVKQAESDQIVKAMKAKNIPVTYVLFPDEGHGFAKPENRMSFEAVSEHFLAGCLDGRAEPYGDDLSGASITVPAGAEHVRGLQSALD